MTKEERYEVYRKALVRIEDHTDDFICDAMGACSGYKHALLHGFPEVEKQKPKKTILKNFIEFWFENNDEGRQKRIEILKQAIEETKP